MVLVVERVCSCEKLTELYKKKKKKKNTNKSVRVLAQSENCHLPSSVSDWEDEQEALPCPHVLFSHGSELFLSSRVEDCTAATRAHTLAE